MELSTPFLHLKFDPLTMQFVSEPNKIDGFGINNLTIGSQNYNCNETSKATSNIENKDSNSTYQSSNIK